MHRRYIQVEELRALLYTCWSIRWGKCYSVSENVSNYLSRKASSQPALDSCRPTDLNAPTQTHTTSPFLILYHFSGISNGWYYLITLFWLLLHAFNYFPMNFNMWNILILKMGSKLLFRRFTYKVPTVIVEITIKIPPKKNFRLQKKLQFNS